MFSMWIKISQRKLENMWMCVFLLIQTILLHLFTTIQVAKCSQWTNHLDFFSEDAQLMHSFFFAKTMCKVVHLQTISTIDMLINNFAFFVSYVWKKKWKNGQKIPTLSWSYHNLPYGYFLVLTTIKGTK